MFCRRTVTDAAPVVVLPEKSIFTHFVTSVVAEAGAASATIAPPVSALVAMIVPRRLLIMLRTLISDPLEHSGMGDGGGK
jgi:hypothetical protein